MKRTRKLLSLFLSAALVGQMGAVVGWGDVACGANNDHGKTNQSSLPHIPVVKGHQSKFYYVCHLPSHSPTA